MDVRKRTEDQVRRAGKKGLLVRIGDESRTLIALVEDGIIYQEIADGLRYRFTHPEVVDSQRRKS